MGVINHTCVVGQAGEAADARAAAAREEALALLADAGAAGEDAADARAERDALLEQLAAERRTCVSASEQLAAERAERVALSEQLKASRAESDARDGQGMAEQLAAERAERNSLLEQLEAERTERVAMSEQLEAVRAEADAMVGRQVAEQAAAEGRALLEQLDADLTEKQAAIEQRVAERVAAERIELAAVSAQLAAAHRERDTLSDQLAAALAEQSKLSKQLAVERADVNDPVWEQPAADRDAAQRLGQALAEGSSSADPAQPPRQSPAGARAGPPHDLPFKHAAEEGRAGAEANAAPRLGQVNPYCHLLFLLLGKQRHSSVGSKPLPLQKALSGQGSKYQYLGLGFRTDMILCLAQEEVDELREENMSLAAALAAASCEAEQLREQHALELAYALAGHDPASPDALTLYPAAAPSPPPPSQAGGSAARGRASGDNPSGFAALSPGPIGQPCAPGLGIPKLGGPLGSAAPAAALVAGDTSTGPALLEGGSLDGPADKAASGAPCMCEEEEGGEQGEARPLAEQVWARARTCRTCYSSDEAARRRFC